MTLKEFINKWTDKPIDFDGVYPNQCFDLAHQYHYDCLGIKDGKVISHPGAYQIFTEFNSNGLDSKYFDKIANTPDGVPQSGDIIVWGQQVGPYGHVAIFVSGDANSFDSFDANWPVGSLPHIQHHDYFGVLGWLKPKVPTNYYKGYDLTNEASMKVAVDVLVKVQNGVFIEVETANGIRKENALLFDKVQTLTNENKELSRGITGLQNELLKAKEKITELEKQRPVEKIETVFSYTRADIVLDKPFNQPYRLIKL